MVVSEKAAESAESYLNLSDSNPVAAQGILETFPGAVLTLLRGLLGFGRCPAAALQLREENEGCASTRWQLTLHSGLDGKNGSSD